jgi:tetraacyldisaccharide 4'-kinase
VRRLPPEPAVNPSPAAPPPLDQYARGVMSGEDRSLLATLLRGALAAAEPLYASAAALRNRTFDAGLRKTHRLPRATVSVGNITTGGTGKTPVVRWLAQRLRDAGRHVAVLSRGYKAEPGRLGDEQLMLDQSLNSAVEPRRVPVVANPDRVAGATEVLRLRPETDVFLLDDGFQHRRAARDLDVVLLSAANPFGYGHVLPRGMLREPLGGLRRAGAFVLTHADQVGENDLARIERTVRRYNATAPVYRAVHAHAALRSAGVPASAPADRSLDELRGRSWFAFCGIGDPGTFLRQLERAGGRHAGHRWFGDHHRYAAEDLAALRRHAAAAGADVLITTEKDWAKLSQLAPAGRDEGPPLWRVDLEVQFRGGDGQRLFDQVVNALGRFDESRHGPTS